MEHILLQAVTGEVGDGFEPEGFDGLLDGPTDEVQGSLGLEQSDGDVQGILHRLPEHGVPHGPSHLHGQGRIPDVPLHVGPDVNLHEISPAEHERVVMFRGVMSCSIVDGQGCRERDLPSLLPDVFLDLLHHKQCLHPGLDQ